MFTLILTSVCSTLATPCNQRSYGKDRIVCVCNETHCDDLEPINFSSGDAIMIETNRAGKRFTKTTITATNSSQKRNFFQRLITVQLMPSTIYQKVLGFGGAFTDSATINIKSLPKTLQNRVIQDYFSTSGLQYNLGRVPIGGTDFSTHCYTYAEWKDDFNLTHFSLTDEDFTYKIPVIKTALEVSSDLRLFASAWSAPWWMKTVMTAGSSGILKGPVCGRYYETWANYYVKFLDAYEKNNVTFWGLTTGNEPVDGLIPFFPFNSLGFTPGLLHSFIKCNLGPALERAGYGTRKLQLILGDDQLPFTFLFARKVLSDSETSQYVSGIAFHWYLNYGLTRPLLNVLNKKFPKHFLLSTESSIAFPRNLLHGPVSLGNWGRAELYAKDILEDLKRSVAGWVDWNLALDQNGGPNWANNYVDAPVIVNKDAKEYYKNPMFYVLAHFSKALPRGSFRVGSHIRRSWFVRADAVAFKTPQNATVIIAYNPDNKPCDITIEEFGRKPIEATLSPHSIATIVLAK